MANKSNTRKKPNIQNLKKLRSALKKAISAIDKIKTAEAEHIQEEEVLFHIAFYLRQLYHRGVQFNYVHGLSYV